MLKRIRVSGFKSLVDFDLEFRRGLNVFIGPNGSGKTNIINFIELLSFLSRDSLLDAVGRSGGAGRIFRRTSYGLLVKQISFEITGDGEYIDYRTRDHQWAAYELSASIELSENNSSIYYSRQRLKLAVNNVPRAVSKWDVDLEVVGSPEGTASSHIYNLVEDAIKPVFGLQQTAELGVIRSEIVRTLSQYGTTRAIHQLIERFSSTRIIGSDLQYARAFNISPATVRMPEDIASEPEISQDGGGLAATLFALKSARHDGYFPYYVSRYFYEPDKLMEKIIAYSKIVNDSIRGISVYPDAVEAKLRIFLDVDYENTELSLPFGLVSDGTAKWFTLVTAIVISSSVFVIEEPENFLHPLMQKEIVRIIRDTFEGRDVFAIMTTHSETILNAIDPDEMILVHMENGRTVAKRPINSEDIRSEIKSTGFGAGYYYIAGAIE
jgi:predicted ATPase